MVKQVIVMRKDLKMRRGKEIAQGAHASIKFLVDRPIERSVAEHHWFETCGQKTVCCYVNSEQELMDVFNKAKTAKVQVYLQTDAGKTEFKNDKGEPVPTVTCLAIGPEYSELVDKITGDLKLY
jgi:PTH2 family peptidyl-tRNA hydrolase